jgi:hypothetical protein
VLDRHSGKRTETVILCAEAVFHIMGIATLLFKQWIAVGKRDPIGIRKGWIIWKKAIELPKLFCL